MAGDLASAAAELRRLGADGSAAVVAGLLHRGNAGRAALLEADTDAVIEATPALSASPVRAFVVPPQEPVRRHGPPSSAEALMSPGQPGVRYRTQPPRDGRPVRCRASGGPTCER